MAKAGDDRKMPFMDPKDVHMGNLHRVLERAVNKAGDDDLAKHLKKVFGFLVLNYPGQALEKFEEVSQLMKEGKDISKYLKIDDARDYSAVAKDQAAYIGEMQKKLNKAQPEGEEEEAVEDAGPVGYVQDMRSDAKQWQWAGIGFGEQETYRLQMHLKKLAKETTMCRFFGKILGTDQDYYIAETQLAEGGEEGGEEVERDPDFEPNGTGVNVYTYFVTHSTMGEWKRLPDVSPAEIRAARQIKILFSGDLERDIYTNPFFFGKEKIYLRAQIARIVHSTTIIPKGIMRQVQEEDSRDIEDNTPEEGDIVYPSTHEMSKPDMWVHKNMNILGNCRTAHIEIEEPADAPEGYDLAEEKKKIEAADPYEARLKPVSADTPIALTKTAKQSPWVVRMYGDAAVYASANPAQKDQCFGTVVVRSLQWPGAYTFYQNEAFHQVYVGSGHKYEQAVSYFPIEPPMVIDDPDEFRLEPEPTPLEEPVEEAKPEGEEGAEEGGEEAE